MTYELGGLVLSQKESGERHLVSFCGEIDLANATAVRDELLAIAESTVVVDLGEVSFLDAAGLAGLLQAKQKSEAGGNAIRFVNAPRAVCRVLEITGTTQLLLADEAGAEE